jgi:hypothetical protein
MLVRQRNIAERFSFPTREMEKALYRQFPLAKVSK